MRKGVCHRILFFYMSELLLSFSPPPPRTITTKMVGYYSHERRRENHSSSCLRWRDREEPIKNEFWKAKCWPKTAIVCFTEIVTKISFLSVLVTGKREKKLTQLSGKRKCVYRISQKKMQKISCIFAKQKLLHIQKYLLNFSRVWSIPFRKHPSLLPPLLISSGGMRMSCQKRERRAQ